jgi:hypothetical protein
MGAEQAIATRELRATVGAPWGEITSTLSHLDTAGESVTSAQRHHSA